MKNDQLLDKLREFVKVRNPQLSDSEINALAGKYLDLAEFLVQLWLKEHHSPTDSQQGAGKDSEARDLPP